MKRFTNHVFYAVIILVILTYCDSVSTSSDQTDLKSVELSAPANASEQSIETELVWNQVKGATSYRLLLSESDKFETSVMDTAISGTSITTPVLKPETTYNWKVSLIENNRSGPWSEIWSFTTAPEDTAKTFVVSLISPVDGSDDVSTDLEFTWEELPGTSEYTYQLSDDSTFSSVITEETVSGTTYKLEGLEHHKKYHWRVKVSGDTDGDTWSEIWSFRRGESL